MLYIADENRGYSARDVLIEGIIKRAKEIFGWEPREKYKFLARTLEEPFSDNPDILRRAVSANVKRNDRVLTTPTHIDFFKEAGVRDIVSFDISPYQLDTYGQNGPSYWCDIFHAGLLGKLLSEVQPNVMYLSNIAEWAKQGSNDVDELALTLSQPNSLKKVMFSAVTANRHSSYLADILEANKWRKEEYSSSSSKKDKVFAMTRD